MRDLRDPVALGEALLKLCVSSENAVGKKKRQAAAWLYDNNLAERPPVPRIRDFGADDKTSV